jgi:hypothetical protein
MVCKGICEKFKAKKPAWAKSRYVAGQKQCSVCDVYMYTDKLNCLCCGMRLSQFPRNKKWKEKVKQGLGYSVKRY